MVPYYRGKVVYLMDQCPKAKSFISPKSFETTMHVPFGEAVKGMGIPKGITLIVGGGYHGKSTLLQALERVSMTILQVMDENMLLPTTVP